MPKTLTEKLNAIKAAGKEFSFPISWLVTMKRFGWTRRNNPLLEDLGVSAIEVGIPFQTLLQMDLLSKKLACAV